LSRGPSLFGIPQRTKESRLSWDETNCPNQRWGGMNKSNLAIVVFAAAAMIVAFVFAALILGWSPKGGLEKATQPARLSWRPL
jgi:hypothetical protein